MSRTVDHIPYLCCVADTKKFHGLYSSEFQDWEQKVKMQFSEQEDWSKYEEWLIDKFIPTHDTLPKTDLDMLSLPKVFKAKQRIIDRIEDGAMQMSMTVSINYKLNIVLVL